MIGLKEVAAHQTVQIDVKKIIYEQIPDEEGRFIPIGITKGQIQWTARFKTNFTEPEVSKITLVGQMEQTDTVNGISSSYFCQNCCDDTVFGRIEPSSNIETDVGSIVQYQSYADGINCYQYPYSYLTTQGATWTSTEPSIARIIGKGTVETLTAGTATIKAKFDVTQHYVYEPCGGGIDFIVANKPFEFKKDSKDEGQGEPTTDAPAPCSCICDPDEITESAGITVKTGIQKIQYQEVGTSNYIDISGTLYVLKDTTVVFKAIPNPANGTFPSGQPTWSGTSGATGTGQTKSVTFNTVSSSTTDYKTVIAKASANGSPKTVNVIVYELTGTLTPVDNFQGRSLIKFGLEEIVNLSFTANPSITATQASGLRWTIGNGTGQLPQQDDGIGTYTAPESAESSTLKLSVLNGPSKNQSITVDITILAPSNGYLVKTSNIEHTFGDFGGAFQGRIYFEPRDVSFSRIGFREGTTTGVATGYLLRYLNGYIHTATPVTVPIGQCSIADGCRILGTDTIRTRLSPAPTPYSNGTFNWAIPWNYYTTSSSVSFTIANHNCSADAFGNAGLQKKGAGPYQIAVNDPTTTF